MRVLMLGDVVGRPGRLALKNRLPALRHELELDFVIANGENASGGIGINSKAMRELFEAGVDVVSSGNHIFKHKEIYSHLDSEPRILRPANYPPGLPGKGVGIYEVKGRKLAVINLLGRHNLENVDCPFRRAEELLSALPEDVSIIFVDFHAETSSEKKALPWFLDGKVSAVAGTHTHVQTNDSQILPQGTGTVTDLGMCGVEASILGLKPEVIVNRFLNQLPAKFVLAEGKGWLCGALFTINEHKGECLGVELLREAV